MFLIHPVREYDPAPFLAVVNGFTEQDWKLDTIRQHRRHFAYRTDSMREGVNEGIDKAFQVLRSLTKPILDAEYGTDWSIGRYVLSRCPPGGGIRLHRDQVADPERMRRLHIPITTNPGAVTIFPYLSKEKQFMPLGTMHEFNFKEPHKTENTGTEHRVHLVFDFYV